MVDIRFAHVGDKFGEGKRYEIIEELGSGGFAQVYKVKDNKSETEEYFALKITAPVQKNKKRKHKLAFRDFYKYLESEIRNMRIMGEKSENSVKLFNDFNYQEAFVCIVMELCDETLEEKLLNMNQGFSETILKYILKQLNKAFKIMNENKIIHRDIKLSNILVVNRGSEFIVKLADYGLSIITDGPTETCLGTDFYKAPEIGKPNSDYNEKVDLWSLGIVIYQLIFFVVNFNKNEAELILNNIHVGNIVPYGFKISDSLFDLLNKLLQTDPNKRLTWYEYFQHPFFNDAKKISLEGHLGHIFSIIELEDGNLASAGSDRTIKIWELKNNYTHSDTLVGHNDSVRVLLEYKNTDKKYLISGSWDKTIRIWVYSNESSKYIYSHTLEGHSSGVVSLAELKDEAIASGSLEGTIIIWQGKKANFIQILKLENHNGIVYSIIQLNNGKLASASSDTKIKIWGKDTNQNFFKVQDLTDHTDAVRLIIELINGKIASCSDDKTIRFWIFEDQNYICEKIINNDSSVYSIIEIQKGQLASASNNEIKLWNMDNYECFLTISEHQDIIFTMTKLNMGMLATGGRDKSIILCDPIYYFKKDEKKEVEVKSNSLIDKILNLFKK